MSDEQSWLDQLPADFEGRDSLSKFKSVGDLAKSYREQEKSLGRVFSPSSSLDEVRSFFQKRGVVPETTEGYPVPEAGGGLKDVLGKLRTSALEAGLPKQVWEKFSQSLLEARTAAAEARKAEWTAATAGKLSEQERALAQRAMDEVIGGNESLKALLEETQLKHHPELVAMFAKAGALMSNDSPPADFNSQSTDPNARALELGKQILERMTKRELGHSFVPRTAEESFARTTATNEVLAMEEELHSLGFEGIYDERIRSKLGL